MTKLNSSNSNRFLGGVFKAFLSLFLGAMLSMGTAYAQDIPQGTGTTASLADGTSVNSAIDFGNDRDWFRVTLLANRTYSFLMQGSSGGGTLSDTYLRLYNAAGGLVAQNDDFAGTFSSFLTYISRTDAVFYIEAAAFGSAQTGTYSLSMSSAAAPPLPQTGWWWSQTEGGQGFGIEILNGRLFIGGFLYNADGTPLWFVSNGRLNTEGNYAGNLTQYTGGQTLTGAFVTPTLTTPSVGLIDITFTSATTATMRWRLTGEALITTKQLSRFPIAGGPVIAPAAGMPERGWYVSPGEDGRGWMLEVQGNQLFMAGFMYGSDGKPIWYLSTGPMSSTGAYSGNWSTYGNGQTYTSVWAQTTVQTNANAGSVILNFTSPTSGSMTLPNGRVIQLIRFGNF